MAIDHALAKELVQFYATISRPSALCHVVGAQHGVICTGGKA